MVTPPDVLSGHVTCSFVFGLVPVKEKEPLTGTPPETVVGVPVNVTVAVPPGGREPRSQSRVVLSLDRTQLPLVVVNDVPTTPGGSV